MSEIRIKTLLESQRSGSYGKFDISTSDILLYIPSENVHGNKVYGFNKAFLSTCTYQVEELTASIIEHETIHKVLFEQFGEQISAELDKTAIEELRDIDEYHPKFNKKANV